MRQPVLFVALLLVITVTAAAQQKQPPTSDKEKTEQQRAEHFEKFAARMLAEDEQRKAIIRDLIDTCAKCRAYDDAYSDAADGSEGKTLRTISSLHCHDILDAKLARTPLDTLAPYLDVRKGADPQIAKLVAVWTLYDAYEYGIEQAKTPR
jgi:hypothetical protein